MGETMRLPGTFSYVLNEILEYRRVVRRHPVCSVFSLYCYGQAKTVKLALHSTIFSFRSNIRSVKGKVNKGFTNKFYVMFSV